MSIKVSQINQSELNLFVQKQILTTTIGDLLDVSTDAEIGGALTFVGSPPIWQCVISTEDPLLTEDGLKLVAGSPPTRELLAVDDTVARRHTRNFFTLPVSGKSNAGVVFSSGAPGFIFKEISGEVDESIYRFFAQNGDLVFDIRNDSNTFSKNWLHVKRDGMDVVIDFNGKQVTVNGEEIATKSDIQTLLDRIEQLESA